MSRTDIISWAYPLALWLHLATVALSVGLFALRGSGVLLGMRWPMRPSVRRLSVFIDVWLLLAGGALWWLLQHHPVRNPWLGAKLVLLVVYIVLGSLALKRARGRGTKALCFLAALACVAFMASVATHRHPLGWWGP
jgi:uncharacterized membrane protein SirB2